MTSTPYPTSVTRLLERINEGDEDAPSRLIAVVYDELHRIAQARIGGAPGARSMQSTELVHEAWIRLEQAPKRDWNGRGHFFSAVANAMRNILVDQARRNGRVKHGGDVMHETMPTQIRAPEMLAEVDLIALNEAIEKLGHAHDRPARIVMLRYFAGATIVEIAEILGTSERTIEREWLFARTWLHRALA